MYDTGRTERTACRAGTLVMVVFYAKATVTYQRNGEQGAENTAERVSFDPLQWSSPGTANLTIFNHRSQALAIGG